MRSGLVVALRSVNTFVRKKLLLSEATSLLSPKLEKDLTDAAIMIASVNWMDFSGGGACIPISYGLSEFLNLRGRPARPAETAMRGQDSFNARYFEIEPGKDGWLGHMVTLLPSSGLLLDGSLWSQESKVLANFEVPKLILAKWRRGYPSVRRLGRLSLTWEPNLKAKAWKRRKWPWEQIRLAMEEAERELR